MHSRLTHLRKKRNKRKKEPALSVPHNRTPLAHPDHALGIEVAPFSDPSDGPTDLSSPSQHTYIRVGMVMMLNKRVTSLRKGGAPLHLENLRK
jgi:hypothetical protein